MQTGIHAPVGRRPAPRTAPRSRSASSVHGSLGLYLAPFGETTQRDARVELRRTRASREPGCPEAARDLGASGFERELGDPLPRAATSRRPGSPATRPTDAIDASQFGVEIVAPVDHYRMAERSVKYAGLFILLTFATVWLIEVVSRVQVHPIQYLLLGSALCLFYLLELSLAEHVGFPLAYGIASIGGDRADRRLQPGDPARAARSPSRWPRASPASTATSTSCSMNEDSALLIGSIGLFAILASVMFVTRNVDWYAMGAGRGARAEGA